MTEPVDWGMLLAASGFSLVLCLALAPLAQRFGLVDHPSERKLHSRPVPLVGGIAIFLAIFIALLAFDRLDNDMGTLFLTGGLLVLVGLVDDRIHLSPLTRFIAQIAACLVMIFAGGALLTDFGSLVTPLVLYLGWLSVPMTVFAAVGVINSFNMVDGMDGLSSMVFMIACIAMAWLATIAGRGDNVILLVTAAAAVSGFALLNTRFPWKRGKAFVYLGDSGSLFLGLFLAWQFIDLGGGDDRALAPVTAVWLFSVPLLDTTYLMRRRVRRGVSAFDADQFHLHHAFLKAGFSVIQTWSCMALLVLVTTIFGLAGELMGWAEYAMFYAFAAFGYFYYRFMDRCWRNHRFLGREMATEASMR